MSNDHPPTSTNLADKPLAMLLEEVAAMAKAGRSLSRLPNVLAEMPSRGLQRAAIQIDQGLNQGVSADEAISSLSTEHQPAVHAAMEWMSESGSSDAVYEVAKQIRQQNEWKVNVLSSAVGPTVAVFITATLLFFMLPILSSSFGSFERPAIDQTSLTSGSRLAFALVGTLSLVSLFLAASWAGTRLLMRRAQQFAATGYLCHWLAFQLASPTQLAKPVDLARLVERAASAAGGEQAALWRECIQRLRDGAVSADALAMPTQTPDAVKVCLTDLASGSRSPTDIAFDLQQIGSLQLQKADWNAAWLGQSLARWLSWLIMIITILYMLIVIIQPVVTLFNEVTG